MPTSRQTPPKDSGDGKDESFINRHAPTLFLTLFIALCQFVFNNNQKTIEKLLDGFTALTIQVTTLNAEVKQSNSIIKSLDADRYTANDAGKDMQLAEQRFRSIETRVTKLESKHP